MEAASTVFRLNDAARSNLHVCLCLRAAPSFDGPSEQRCGVKDACFTRRNSGYTTALRALCTAILSLPFSHSLAGH